MSTAVAPVPASSPALSDWAATSCAADVYALHYRLRRCIAEVEQQLTSAQRAESTTTPGQNGRASASGVRRLAVLLREAEALERRVRRADRHHADMGTPSDAVPADEDTGAPLRAYYRQQLQTQYVQLRCDTAAARRLLSSYLSRNPALTHLPISCVGTAPRVFTDAASAQTCHVFTDVLPPHAAHIPAPAQYSITSDASAAATAVRASTRAAEPATTHPSAHGSIALPASAAAAVAAPPTAEERIMEDIQHAIHQMKDGALQMSALMEQEKSQMKSAADLLSGGVAKGQSNMKELDRVDNVGAAMHIPWVLARVPGMSLLWRTVLQPMWAVLKQALLMAAIVAVTGCVLLLISVVPKPIVFRGRQTHERHGSPPTTNAAPLPPPEPLKAATPQPPAPTPELPVPPLSVWDTSPVAVPVEEPDSTVKNQQHQQWQEQTIPPQPPQEQHQQWQEATAPPPQEQHQQWREEVTAPPPPQEQHQQWQEQAIPPSPPHEQHQQWQEEVTAPPPEEQHQQRQEEVTPRPPEEQHQEWREEVTAPPPPQDQHQQWQEEAAAPPPQQQEPMDALHDEAMNDL
ncbi:hypothetical protein NESM_000436400 [Novymonas esmeraldas]|uniref:Uncharacterized protein n=1 Tax=Novymonas esmeraldas TaxID=1808958 RepID=A0AAW0ENS7_9TRYP